MYCLKANAGSRKCGGESKEEWVRKGGVVQEGWNVRPIEAALAQRRVRGNGSSVEHENKIVFS